MNKIKKIGVIEFGSPGQLFILPEINKSNGYIVSKILYKNHIPENITSANHPDAEIVTDHESIIGDSLIDMVILASPNNNEMNIVGEILKANKPIRII